MPTANGLASSRLTGLAREVTQLVAAIAATVQRAQGRLRRQQIHRKGAGDFVTAVDVRAERQLRRALTRLEPAAGFLGEETPPAALTAPLLWVVDPIDGTSNFAAGLPHFAVSVALLLHGDPVLGVVHCAPEQATYVAIRGRGARRNGRRIRIPAGRLDDGAIVGCQWHRGQQDLAFLAALQRRGSRIRTFGSTVTQLADVVCGRLDANVQQQGRGWDFAAAGLLVEEAGGRFTDWQGRRIFPLRDLPGGHHPTVAAAAPVHALVVKALRGLA